MIQTYDRCAAVFSDSSVFNDIKCCMGTNRMDSIAAYVSIALSIGAIVMGIVNHKRIRSSCCGKEASMSLDIEATTPPALEKKSETFLQNDAQVHSGSDGKSEVQKGSADEEGPRAR